MAQAIPFAELAGDGNLHGMMAEFHDEHALLEGIKRAKAAGFTDMEAYTPMPCEAVMHELGQKTHLPWIVLAGGTTGAAVGFGMQAYLSAVDYPLNIGGRPLVSWPSFIIITFELTILFSAFAAVLGMIILNGLPMPYHPVFNVERFKGASRDRFFLVVHASDPLFDPAKTRRALQAVGAKSIDEVPN